MKIFYTLADAQKEIKRLKKKLCCCPNNCPVADRTYYGDEMLISDPVQLQVSLNGNQIYGVGGLDAAATIIEANIQLAGIATFSFENGKIKMITTICANFGLTAAIDGG